MLSTPTPKAHLKKLALKSLRKDNSIIIIPADKGKAVVIMHSDEYTN